VKAKDMDFQPFLDVHSFASEFKLTKYKEIKEL